MNAEIARPEAAPDGLLATHWHPSVNPEKLIGIGLESLGVQTHSGSHIYIYIYL